MFCYLYLNINIYYNESNFIYKNNKYYKYFYYQFNIKKIL